MSEQTYQSAYYQENREEILAAHRAWYKANKEKVIARALRRQKQLSKAKRRAIARRYYEKNREAILARARKAYRDNAKDKNDAKGLRRRERTSAVVRGPRTRSSVPAQ